VRGRQLVALASGKPMQTEPESSTHHAGPPGEPAAAVEGLPVGDLEALMVAGREQPGYFGQKGRAVIRARDQRAGQFASRPGAILRAFESAELGPSIRCRRRGGCVVAPAIAVCIRTRTSCLS